MGSKGLLRVSCIIELQSLHRNYAVFVVLCLPPCLVALLTFAHTHTQILAVRKKNYYIGTFASAEEAAMAYDDKIVALRGTSGAKKALRLMLNYPERHCEDHSNPL